MKVTPNILKHTLLMLMAFTGSVACAQVKFKVGDEFQRKVLTRSNCVLQRGSQTLHVTSFSEVEKTYRVADASDRGATLTITTTKLNDTINTMDQRLIYNYGKPVDPNSPIQIDLKRMANAQPTVSVDKKGQILSARQPTTVNDTLLSFAGIQPDNLSAGSTLQFMVSFRVDPTLKPGYSWAQNSATTQITYTIYSINARTTVITYKASILGGNLNSRINGSLLISNDTGIILKRASQSVSTGYEMVNGIVYTATRRTAATEVNGKK